MQLTKLFVLASVTLGAMAQYDDRLYNEAAYGGAFDYSTKAEEVVGYPILAKNGIGLTQHRLLHMEVEKKRFFHLNTVKCLIPACKLSKVKHAFFFFLLPTKINRGGKSTQSRLFNMVIASCFCRYTPFHLQLHAW